MKRRSHVMLCNGAPEKFVPAKFRRNTKKEALAYEALGPGHANLDVGLPRFVSNVYHLPDRVLDLLELAAYVFCTDRWIGRGAKDAVEYDAWGRTIHYVIKVRDHAFWQRSEVGKALTDALTWATGDESHSFTFVPGHSTPATGLFDREEVRIEARPDVKVALFSGGIDSLAGTVQHLKQEAGPLYLVSHRSSSIVQKIQSLLLESLKKRYPNRIYHYPFVCRLKGKRAAEETQRSRSFLFSSIAYALASAANQDRFFIYENGVTSLNLPKREGMGLARASRTTHPRTIAGFEQFLSLVHERDFVIETPFFWKTKTDVLNVLKENGGSDLFDTSVSCTRTFDNEKDRTHCGGCSQCVDRRFAAVAAGLADQDHRGLYTTDFINDPIEDGEARTFVVDYLHQAKEFATASPDRFESAYLTELATIEDHVKGVDKLERIRALYELCSRHGQQTMHAVRLLNDPTREPKPHTLLALLSSREYIKTPVTRLCDAVCDVLSRGLPMLFKHKPKDENDFNDKVDGLLNSRQSDFKREHPVASFARAKLIPDHLHPASSFLIESKYIRGATTPSKVTDGLAADLYKLPPAYFKLCLVYDPDRAIANDDDFRNGFESRGNCRVLVVR